VSLQSECAAFRKEGGPGSSAETSDHRSHAERVSPEKRKWTKGGGVLSPGLHEIAQMR